MRIHSDYLTVQTKQKREFLNITANVRDAAEKSGIRDGLILISALQVDKAILFSTAITIAAFIPLFTMQGVEGQIFGPMARTYGYALAGALIATFTITPVLASFLLPQSVKEVETIVVRALHKIYTPVLTFALNRRFLVVGIGAGFILLIGLLVRLLIEAFPKALRRAANLLGLIEHHHRGGGQIKHGVFARIFEGR